MDLNLEEGFWNATATLLVYGVVSVVVGGGFLMVDLYHKPHWIFRYKIQKDNTKVDPAKLKKLWHNILLNSTVILLPSSVLFYLALKWRGCDLSFSLPGWKEFMFHIMSCILIEEIVFYYSHRMLHTPFFYKYIHKKHHEWTAPISFTAVYAHPFEMLVSNLMSLVLGPLICGSNFITTLLWLALSYAVTLIHHSGYHVPFLPSPEFHDFHHLKFIGNYGVIGVLDRLHDTDKLFRKSRKE
ncbi:fatty acid hydroxylase domain-containing protein 2-like [Saccostrea echinata]|uniref:fatty acid hydroxylase domain-containing protein 2-like n=1 Tax=Saccostrea echinata TaxID=191078 RepID=UPI002A8198CE|nr:fatty acid hydroxylase domain-containing protein 2-like [Saccostrea echinata]